MKPKKKKSNKLLITCLTLILSAVVIAGVFLGTYYYMMNESLGSVESGIKDYVKQINDVNKRLGSLNKGQTLDTELAKKELPGDIEKLLNIKDNAQKFTSTERYKESFDNLVEGLNNNINLYKQILAVLQNPNSKDLQNAYNDLNKYKDECLNHYALFNVKDMKIDLPQEALQFVNSASAYTLELAKSRRDSDIKNSQAVDFSSKLDGISQRFVPLKTDYSQQLQKVRSGNGSFNDILNLIDQHKDQYNTIKKDFLSLIVPDDNARAVQTAFKGVLDSYESSYLPQIKFSVTNEQAKTTPSTPLKSDDIKGIYADANTNFSKMSDKYEAFLKAFNDYKSKNIK